MGKHVMNRSTAQAATPSAQVTAPSPGPWGTAPVPADPKTSRAPETLQTLQTSETSETPETSETLQPPAPSARGGSRKAQFLALLAMCLLMGATMSRFTDVFRTEAAKKLPDATPGELSLATWSAWAASSFFNVLAYLALVLALGALGAVICRQFGARADFRPLRQLVGTVLAGYLALRTAAFLVLTTADVNLHALLEGLSAPDPSLLLAAGALALTIRRAHPGLGAARLGTAAVLPVAALGLLQAVL
ncbi:hypothetical protein ACH4SP_40625 [Streptomyces sp. NPDC021093]|uniref:hypothetical protein n=1 Tax=Streptomyces sp. NPDC021093 TaxID=3365112 RepID=UPI0037BCD557